MIGMGLGGNPLWERPLVQAANMPWTEKAYCRCMGLPVKEREGRWLWFREQEAAYSHLCRQRSRERNVAIYLSGNKCGRTFSWES